MLRSRRRTPITAAPVGVVLAGGAGRRMGGDKAIVELEGQPLVTYPVRALREVVGEVVVVAKRSTLLPSLAGVADVWIEPDEPRHPLSGIVHALRVVPGRPVLVVAVDLPFVDAATLRALLDADAAGAAAIVPRCEGRLQPLCALYLPHALAALEDVDPTSRLTEVVAALPAAVIDVDDPQPFFNVNRPEDLLQASARLPRRAPRGLSDRFTG